MLSNSTCHKFCHLVKTHDCYYRLNWFIQTEDTLQTSSVNTDQHHNNFKFRITVAKHTSARRQCRSKIRLHVLCSEMLTNTEFKGSKSCDQVCASFKIQF